MIIRKWGVERHPTVKPIPISIAPIPFRSNCDEYVPLLKDSDFYERAMALVKEHNALVDEINRLKAADH